MIKKNFYSSKFNGAKGEVWGDSGIRVVVNLNAEVAVRLGNSPVVCLDRVGGDLAYGLLDRILARLLPRALASGLGGHGEPGTSISSSASSSLSATLGA